MRKARGEGVDLKMVVHFKTSLNVKRFTIAIRPYLWIPLPLILFEILPELNPAFHDLSDGVLDKLGRKQALSW